MNYPSDKTVLIVNDSADQRELMQTIFQQAGYRVLTASEGREGFQFAKSNQLDLIISDVVLPDGDGIELCQWIRSDEKLRSLPILLVSELGKEVGKVVEVLEVGADAYIELPVEPTHLIAKAKRLIERKRTEDLLRNSEERYRIFLAQSSEAIWRFETEPPCPVDISADEQIDWLYRCGYLAECNDAMARMYGYESAGEITGASIGEMLPQSDPANIEYLREFIRSGYQLANADSHEIDKEGNPRIFSNSLSGIVEDGCIMRVWGVQRDITEQRRAETELRQSESRIRALLDAIPDLMFRCDKDGKILDFSATHQEDLLLPPSEFIGKNLRDVLPPPVVQQSMRHITSAIETGTMQIFEYQLEMNGIEKSYEARIVAASDSEVTAIVRDVTERKRDEADLTRLAVVAQKTQNAVIITDAEGYIQWVNEGFTRLTGYEFDEVVGSLGYLLQGEETDAEMVETIRTTMWARKPFSGEIYNYKKDGTGFWMSISITPTYDDNGEVQGFVAVQMDITERKQAEAKLRRSEANLAAAQRITHLGSWEVELSDLRRINNNKVHWSDEVYRIFGYEPGQIEVSINHYFDSIHQDDSKYCRRAFSEAVTNRKNLNIEFRIILPNESERILHGQGEVIYDEQSNIPLKFIGTVQDITERKLAESALEQSERDYRTVFEQAHDAIMVFAPEHEIVLDVNQRACELYGFSRSEFIGMSIETISKNPDSGKDKVKEVLEIGEYLNFETVQYRKGGTEMFLEVNASTIIYQGQEAIITINRDITERKLAEVALQKSLSLLTSTFEATADGIAVFDSKFNIVNFNNKFLEMWRITEDTIKGRNNAEAMTHILDQLANPADFLNRVEQLQSNLDNTCSDIIEFKDGRVYERYVKPQLLEGNIIGQVLSFRDITERKQSERDIRFQAHLLDTVEQAVIATDVDGIVVYWNEYAQNLYGWSAAEALGCNIIELNTPKLSHEQAMEIMSDLRKGKGWTGEFIVQHRNGKTFPSAVANSPIYDDKGTLIGIVGISNDVTERKQAERALVEANERAIREYERLLDRVAQLAESLGTARDLLTIYRALYTFAVISAPCTGFFISLYDAERNVRLPGYARSDGEELDTSNLPPMEMSGSPNSRAISTGTIIIEDDFQSAMAGKPIVNIGLDKNPDLPQSCLVAPMSVMGRIVGAVEVQSNVPAAYTKEHATAMRMAANLVANAIENVRLLEQEREHEERLRLSQKLESVGRLAGGIAHDFNNMLTAINGYSELTLRKLEEGNPLRRNIEEIKKAGERSAALTHQLLAFSRQQVLQSRVLDLNEIINDTIQMLHRLIGENIQLNTALDSKLGRVEADPGQLAQVLMNLAVNARDAMPEGGGKLTIETANVHLDKEYVTQHFSIKPGSYISLAVNDTGVGIDAEIQQHIFEPFFTTKEVGKGTGLGLATVYGIVKQSGGYIWVYSEIGHGTSFKIYLPRIDEEVAAEVENSEYETAPKGAETILIVEDEDIVRALTRQILEESGYKVIEACNGVEALSICKEQSCKIDLLMTDVVMPKMGGRELAEKMARIQPNLRVLFTSGYTDDAVIRHNVIEADTNFIQKPFTFDALAHKVRESLDNEN